VLILLGSIGLILFIAIKSNAAANFLDRLQAPEWLRNHAALIAALWILAALFKLHAQVRAARARQAHDWLAALPIAAQARWRFVGMKYASIFSVELLLGAALIAWLAGLAAATLFLLSGALLAALVIAYALRASEINFVSSAVVNPPRNPSSTILRAPLQAWFLGLLPTHAQMRWFWLLPLLLLPAAASLPLIGGAMLTFAAFTRISAVAAAIRQANLQVTTLLDASPLPANKLYQASWRFAAHTILPLLLIAALFAWLMPLKLAIFAAASVIALGVLAIVSQLHFSFAFRYLNFPQPDAHSEASAKARAWIIYLILCVLLMRELAPLLPIFCLLSWRWLYRRGLAAGTGQPV